MRFWLGLALGLVVGGASTWLAVKRPWRSSPPAAIVASDAGPVASGEPKGKKKKRRGNRGGGDGADGVEAPAPVLSAADREPTSRGPAIALPARSLDLGTDDDARPLESGEINDVVQRSSQPVLDCIEDARLGASLSGKIVLEMLVGGDGRATKVRVTAPRWLIEHGFADCARRAATAMRFPATGAPTVVDIPYTID